MPALILTAIKDLKNERYADLGNWTLDDFDPNIFHADWFAKEIDRPRQTVVAKVRLHARERSSHLTSPPVSSPQGYPVSMSPIVGAAVISALGKCPLR
jgi:hypothetical protein